MTLLTSIIDPSYKVPGAFMKVSLGAGPRSPGSSGMKVLGIVSKTAAGTAVVGQLYQVAGRDDAATLMGAGSEGHLLAKAFFDANPIGRLYLVAMDDSSGGAVATKTVAVTGTATSAGQLEVWVGGERMVVPIAVGDTATVIGAALASIVNGRSHLPVTGVNTTGSVALSTKNKGVRFNALTCRSLLINAAGISHTPVTGTFASGTASGANPTTHLDAVGGSERFHVIISGFQDSTNLAKFKTAISSLAAPLQGKRGIWAGAFVGTLGDGITLSDALNDPRGVLLWDEGSDDLTCQVVGAWAGAHTAYRAADRAANTDGMALGVLKPRFSAADRPTKTEQNIALNNGLVPLVDEDGVVLVCREITNYHQDGSGNDDFTILDNHKVEVADFIADDLEGNFSSVWSAFKLGVDGEDGVPNAPRVATASSVKDWVISRLGAQENRTLVNTALLAPSIVVEADESADGRLNADVPIDVIELFHQLAANVSQVG